MHYPEKKIIRHENEKNMIFPEIINNRISIIFLENFYVMVNLQSLAKWDEWYIIRNNVYSIKKISK